MRSSLLLATVLAGLALATTRPAYADWPVIDLGLNQIIQTMQKALENAITNIGNQITNAFNSAVSDMTNPNSLTRILQEGFNQNANYSKATTAANAQIANANNLVQSQLMMTAQNTQIRDQHIPSPEFCSILANNQTALAGSRGSRNTSLAISLVTEPRGEGEPGTPSHLGTAQGVEANNYNHMRRYCSQGDVEDGLCTTVSTLPAADQRAESIWKGDTITGNGALDAANDFAMSLTQPYAPTPMRGDQIRSTEGQQAWADRRAYNARMALAKWALSYTIGVESPSVTMDSAQQSELQAEGGQQPADNKISWLQSVALSVNRAASSAVFAAELERMPPATVMREIVNEIAMSNYLALENYRVALLNSNLEAARLARDVQHDAPNTSIPTPTLASP